PRAALVGEGATVGVQRLVHAVPGIGGAGVEAAELEARAEHGLDGGEEEGLGDALGEEGILVDEVGQAARARLLLELGAGLVALPGIQGLEAIEHALAQGGVDGAGEREVAEVAELAALVGGQHRAGILMLMSSVMKTVIFLAALIASLAVGSRAMAQAAPPNPDPYTAPPPSYGAPPPGYGTVTMPPQNAFLMYDAQRRNAGLAILIELFVPGLGSLYGDHGVGALITW